MRIKQHRAVEAVKNLEESLELDPEAAETHYALATVLVQQLGDFQRGEGAYREAIRLQPDYSAAHMNLAILLYRGNKAEEAREHFERAIRAHPEYALGHYNYGLMLIAEGLREQAREQFELALERPAELDPASRAEASRRVAELVK